MVGLKLMYVSIISVGCLLYIVVFYSAFSFPGILICLWRVCCKSSL